MGAAPVAILERETAPGLRFKYISITFHRVMVEPQLSTLARDSYPVSRRLAPHCCLLKTWSMRVQSCSEALNTLSERRPCTGVLMMSEFMKVVLTLSDCNCFSVRRVLIVSSGC